MPFANKEFHLKMINVTMQTKQNQGAGTKKNLPFIMFESNFVQL